MKIKKLMGCGDDVKPFGVVQGYNCNKEIIFFKWGAFIKIWGLTTIFPKINAEELDNHIYREVCGFTGLV